MNLTFELKPFDKAIHAFLTARYIIVHILIPCQAFF